MSAPRTRPPKRVNRPAKTQRLEEQDAAWTERAAALSSAEKVVVVQRVLQVFYSFVDRDGEGVLTEQFTFLVKSLKEADMAAALDEARAKRASLELEVHNAHARDGKNGSGDEE